MRKVLFIIGAISLHACSRDGKHISVMTAVLGNPPESNIPIVETGPYQAPPLYAYILMGQSNMSRMSQTYAANFQGWPSYESSPAIAMAMSDPKALYIQCAVASTPIKRWIPGADLYEKCLSEVPANLPIKGVFFWQGESDAQLADTVPPGFTTYAWAQAFESIVDGLRSHFNIPSLPIIFAQIATNTRPKTYDPILWQHVKDEQASVSMSNVFMIYTDDQTLSDDGEHLLSYGVVGQRFASAMLHL